jgi:hypothetical protein
MKKMVLTIMLCCFFGVGIVSADVWSNIGRTIGRAWEDIKRESTNVLQPVEKTINKALKEISNVGHLKVTCSHEFGGKNECKVEFETK